MTLDTIKTIAIPACHKYDVKWLDIFGSFARGSETPQSDIDSLVEFENPHIRSAKRFFGLLHYFEDALNRKIDLLTTHSLKNPYFRDRVLSEKINIYNQLTQK
ncbi:MAG: nucleotidyltransferase family protein [Chloroflexota bacterium]